MNEVKMKSTLKLSLNRLMDKNEMPRKTLAHLAGVSLSQVARWQAGGLLPTFEKLERISRIFDVDMDELVGENCSKKTYIGRVRGGAT